MKKKPYIVVALFAAFLTRLACADAEVINGVRWYYNVETNGEATVTSVDAGFYNEEWGSNVDLVVPSTLGGAPVTAFTTWHVCNGSSEVRSFTIPDSVRSIAGGFRNCHNVTNVTIGAGLAEIGAYAFSDLPAATVTIAAANSNLVVSGSFILDKRDPTKLVKAFGVSGACAVPSSVKEIGIGAFSDSALTSVSLPSGLTKIGDYAFAGCSGLQAVEIPSGVKSIGERAFAACSSLTSASLPSGLERIGEYSFTQCSSLLSVALPSTLAEVADGAFEGCRKLVAISWNNGIKRIGYAAFGECFALTAVSIPNSVTNIDDSAFYSCTNLVTATLGSGVKVIGKAAFAPCESLMNFEVNAANATYEEIGGCVFYRNTPKTAKELAVYPSGRSDLYFTGDVYVTRIGQWACVQCNNFTEIAVTNSVLTIGEESFENCEKLSKLTVPYGVVAIETGAFKMNMNLCVVDIAGSVKTIGDEAFVHDFMPWAEDEEQLEQLRAGMRLTLHEGTESIGEAAFDMTRELPEVTIPNSVKTIGMDAFESSGLYRAVIGDGVTEIPEYAFCWCTRYGGEGKYDLGLSLVYIGDNVRRIGQQAFQGAPIYNLFLPASVETLEPEVFYNCDYLERVVFLGDRPECAVATNYWDNSVNSNHPFYGINSEDCVIYVSKNASGWDEVFDGSSPVGYWCDREVRYIEDCGDFVQVRFDRNDGSNQVVTRLAVTNEVIGALPVPARSGYDFDGWTTGVTNGNVKVSWSYRPTAALTLYAQWKESSQQTLPVAPTASYTVKFDANGGSAVAARTCKANAALGTLPTATRTGYTLAGWYTAKSGGTKVAATTKVTKKATYYARWTANAYTVKFDANGGAGKAMANKKYAYDKQYTLPDNTFTRKGFTFLGWSKAKGAAVDYKDKAKVKNLSAKNGATVTLYAVWLRNNEYMVNFDGNGATSGGAKAQTVAVGAKSKLTANAFKRAGWEFLGWSTKKTADKAEYKDKAQVSNLAKAGKSVTLYAVWALPSWATGTFYGDCEYDDYDRSRIYASYVGVMTAKVTSQGKLTGTMTWANGKGKSIVKTFAASDPAYTASYKKKSFKADFEEDDVPLADGSCWTYRGVKVVTPAGTTEKMDIRVANCKVYDGKTRAGEACAVVSRSLGAGRVVSLDGLLSQDVWTNSGVKSLPKFASKTTKALAVKSSDNSGLYRAGVRKLSFAFADKGVVTVTAQNASGKALDKYEAHLLVDCLNGKKFECWMPVYFKKLGCMAWVDADVKKSSAAKAADITLGFDD